MIQVESQFTAECRQAPSFASFVNQSLDLLTVFVYREFFFFLLENIKVLETFTQRSAAKKVLVKAFAKFTGKHLSWNLF